MDTTTVRDKGRDHLTYSGRRVGLSELKGSAKAAQFRLNSGKARLDQIGIPAPVIPRHKGKHPELKDKVFVPDVLHVYGSAAQAKSR